MVYGETGCVPLQGEVLTRMAGFWGRLIQGHRSKLSFMLYKLLRSAHYDRNTAFKSDWISSLEKTFTDYNLIHFCENDSPGLPMGHILATIKEKFKSNFMSNWRIEIENSVSCIGYDEFKSDFKLEPYLLKLKFGHRLTLAKFRCRSNYLPIASFEQFNNPYFVPECPFCKNDYADEEHYLLYCPNFNEQRAFLSHCFPDLNDNPCPIKSILCTDDEDTLIQIAKFCRKIMDKIKKSQVQCSPHINLHFDLPYLRNFAVKISLNLFYFIFIYLFYLFFTFNLIYLVFSPSEQKKNQSVFN